MRRIFDIAIPLLSAFGRSSAHADYFLYGMTPSSFAIFKALPI